jgi:DNA (cytosine-5)-methyltransferase 1
VKFISLFAGIGGLDLGLERAGMECVAQVEINEFALKVLQKHWANVPKFKDVRDVGKHNLPPADLICGGFPCQDVSLAGKQKGLEGKRSTLWSEFHRIVCEIRPRWVVIENVPGLLSSDNGEFFTKIFRELSTSGYDAEWRIISASDLGAPHIRERLFIVAYPNGYIGLDGVLQTGRDTFKDWRKKSVWGFDWSKSAMESRPATILQRWQRLAVRQSPLIRMDDGIPDVVERLHATGNAVVPQVAEFIGHCIMKAETCLTQREPDKRDSAAFQAFTTPEVLSDLEGLS